MIFPQKEKKEPMKANRLLDTWWKPAVWTVLWGTVILLLSQINTQPEEMGIPEPFWQSILGTITSTILLVWGLILLGSGNPKGWTLLAALSFIFAQWLTGAAKIIPTIASLACIWTWAQWKKRGWFKNFTARKK